MQPVTREGARRPAELLRHHIARTPGSRIELRPGLNHLLMPATVG